MSQNGTFQVAAIQMVSSTSVQANLDAAARLIDQAGAQGAQLVLLPEYFCFLGRRDPEKLALMEAPGSGPIQQFLADTARRHGIWLLGGTLPLQSEDANRIYNALLVFDPAGNQVARYDKIHLFGFRKGQESYDESISIRPGSNGPQVVDTPLGKVGLSVCYDLRFPELYRAMNDVSLIVVPSAFTYTTGSAHWEILLRARAIENQCYVLAAAQGGKHENGRRTWGHSMLIDPWGDVVACLPEGEGAVTAALDLGRIESVRQSLPALAHRVIPVGGATAAHLPVTTAHVE
ncbi:nitrilase-related carbon-nitrogen hydrolase [Yanghanlia caeni]|uniref:Carbon-nitrogen hydrolase family protein n=1 Tax=Yanghanlia caeni TaxID=3064283 RepID=A0ABU1D5K6_9BURK|nr:carbon-nitrogen hydrolase family protein [Alcaligenaceae bacterium LG-2]NGR07344.1 carbon-nitrogen hydrolase family protein [bacterium SGD-2]HZH56365.1 carbon-nitrogen hydrolase family protein [Burkholderiaceae bacterium]